MVPNLSSLGLPLPSDLIQAETHTRACRLGIFTNFWKELWKLFEKNKIYFQIDLRLFVTNSVDNMTQKRKLHVCACLKCWATSKTDKVLHSRRSKMGGPGAQVGKQWYTVADTNSHTDDFSCCHKNPWVTFICTGRTFCSHQGTALTALFQWVSSSIQLAVYHSFRK